MKDKIDELLSKEFSDKTDLGNENSFTAEVMNKLPRHGISPITRTAILLLFTAISVSIPLFSAADGDLYTFVEVTLTDGLITFQYYMSELVYMV